MNLRIKKLVLGEVPDPHLSAPPSSGEIHFGDVTIVAGPNGSGKSRLLKWLFGALNQVNRFPLNSVIEFVPSSLHHSPVRNYVQKAYGEGKILGTLKKGRSLQLINSEFTNYPYLPDIQPDPRSGEIGIDTLPQAARTLSSSTKVLVNQGVVIELPKGEHIPTLFEGPRMKVLDAKRFSHFSSAFRRRTDLNAAISQGMRDSVLPDDLFSLLESDPALEIEVLSRIEALTSVRIEVKKEGSEYRLLCSRVGVKGEWSWETEADGVIALLILLPYLYSKEYSCVMIDEPEAHLYPGLQQTIRTLIYDAANRTDKQVLLATHSERIVAPPLTNFRKTIHITIPDPVRPKVVQLDDVISHMGSDASSLHQWLTRQMFGENQDSVLAALFASETVIVEGVSDLVFFDRLARYVGREFRAGSAAVLEAGGKAGIAMIARLLKAMGRKVKVIVDSNFADQIGVLRKIALSMGDSNGEIEAALNQPGGTLRTIARKYDIHILSKKGIELYYHSLKSQLIPESSGEKREAMIRELKEIETMDVDSVRERYPELVEILESVVRRMPDAWLDAHCKEVNELLARVIREWRILNRNGVNDVNELRNLLQPHLERFDRVEFKDGTLQLFHRFLSGIPLSVTPDANPVVLVEEWAEHFRVH